MTASNPSIPVTLLTGFLGAGKTTLLNTLLADPGMKGTAVIVNEFGSIGLDHDLVLKGSDGYVHTTTGCICCTAASDVRISLFELNEALARGDIPEIARVVIETTGLADPAPIINSLIPGGAPAMGLRDHVVARKFHLAGVLTVFDVTNGRALLDSFIEGWKQLAFADHIILTKTDLPAGTHDWIAELTDLNPAATFHDRNQEDFSLATLIEDRTYSLSGKAEDVSGWLALEQISRHDDHPHDPNRHGDGIEVIVLRHDVPFSSQAIDTFLHVVTSNTNSGLLRLKGLMNISDSPRPEVPVVVHAVQNRLYPLQQLSEWPDDNRETRLVLIGQNMPIKQIRDLFNVLAPKRSEKKWRLI